MKRRDFVQRVSGAAVAAGLWPFASAATRDGAFTAWTWVHGGGDRTADQWRAAFARVAAAGISGVLVTGGDTAMLADAAHGAGLRFHRWTWIVNRSGDTWVKEHHPEWFAVSREGKSSLTNPPYVPYYQWVCPTRQPVRQYLKDLVAGVAADPHVDGVHLDYIRLPDVILPVALWAKYHIVQDKEYPPYDFCYCEVCRGAFKAQSGTDPLDLADPTANVAWREFRWNSVSGLVRELAGAVHAAKKPISAAVFPTPTIARTLVRQAWDQWPLDFVFPMLYHSFYNEGIPWIGAGVREGVAALKGRPLYAGLYLPDLKPGDLASAVRVARDAGAGGVSLFDFGGLSDGHLAVLKEALGG